jgi:hypothetical protein
MELSDIAPYIGMPYKVNSFDCADFALHVANHLFSKGVTLPAERPRGSGCEAHLADASKAYGVPTQDPVNGDIVLMYDLGDSIGSPSHVGVYIELGAIPHVLHSAAKFGGAVATRLSRLGRFGITIEGYYKWLS